MHLPQSDSLSSRGSIIGSTPATIEAPVPIESVPQTPRVRRIFSNRTLNMRSIKAVGYDMDYTLIHYHVESWERRAYEHTKARLAALGMPVESLEFDPAMFIRGLVIDNELGNIVKANRFGYIKRAFHGTRPLDFEAQRAVYSRTMVDLAEPRWQFMNTLFSLSEACLYAQLVDKLDRGELLSALGYLDLYKLVRESVDEAHLEGELKANIMAQPDDFVALDPEAPLALLDQKRAGKKLLLITNSGWAYCRAMMSYAFDRFLPDSMKWEDLFDLIVVEAKKPRFFIAENPIFTIANDEGLLRPVAGRMGEGRRFLGGHATLIEQRLGLSGDEILYVGDHIYGDVNVSKKVLRWRTALIVRELEEDIEALDRSGDTLARLERMMSEKEALEAELCQVRLGLQRKQHGYGPTDSRSEEALNEEITRLRAAIIQLDDNIRPLALESAKLHSKHWGLLMRTGKDKSHLARQVERHADIYTSRVSNFLYSTPFAFMRSLRGTLPHDAELPD